MQVDSTQFLTHHNLIIGSHLLAENLELHYEISNLNSISPQTVQIIFTSTKDNLNLEKNQFGVLQKIVCYIYKWILVLEYLREKTVFLLKVCFLKVLMSFLENTHIENLTPPPPKKKYPAHTGEAEVLHLQITYADLLLLLYVRILNFKRIDLK